MSNTKKKRIRDLAAKLNMPHAAAANLLRATPKRDGDPVFCLQQISEAVDELFDRQPEGMEVSAEVYSRELTQVPAGVLQTSPVVRIRFRREESGWTFTGNVAFIIGGELHDGDNTVDETYLAADKIDRLRQIVRKRIQEEQRMLLDRIAELRILGGSRRADNLIVRVFIRFVAVPKKLETLLRELHVSRPFGVQIGFGSNAAAAANPTFAY
jgi:hypothetical protein